MPHHSEAGPSQARQQSDPPPSSSVLQTYTDIYHTHLTHTQLHVLGRSSIKDSTSHPRSGSLALSWSADERDAFFHALAVHSRLRPDLIAQEVGSKSVVDVCAYIDILDEALAQLEAEGDEDSITRRRDIPAAFEMTDRWCALEDKLASSIASAESELVAQARVRVRKREAADLRRQKTRKTRSKPEEEGGGQEMYPHAEKSFEELRSEIEVRWKEEDFILDRKLLRQLDMALQGGKGQETQDGEAEDGDEVLKNGSPIEGTETTAVSRSSTTVDVECESIHAAENNTPNAGCSLPAFDDNLIDPLLLAEAPPSPPKAAVSISAEFDTIAPVTAERNQTEADEISSSSSEEDWETQTVRSRASSRRRRQKILSNEDRQKLESMGFDYDRAHEAGLHLFRLQRLAILMSLYRTSHAAPADTLATVALPTIKGLAALLKDFTYHAVKLAIASRQRERAWKQGSKVWKHSQQPIVSARNVQHAIALMGIDYAKDKRRLLRILNGEKSTAPSASPVSKPAVPDRTHENNDDRQDASQQSDLLWRTQGLNMHRAIRPPMIKLSYSLLPPHIDFYRYSHPDRPLSPVLPTPWPPPLSLRSLLQEEDLMPDSTETDNMDSELENEEEIERNDMTMSAADEKGLWEKFGVDSGIRSEPQVHLTSEVMQAPKRKRAPSPEDRGRGIKQKTGVAQPTQNPPKPSRSSMSQSKLQPSKSLRKKVYKSKETISDSD